MYCLVFMQRTAPGLVSQKLMAEYAITPAVLSLMTVAQYLTYAVLQIPVGLFASRFHPERLLVLGTVLDGVGTIVFGASGSFDGIILSRIIVGVGDAMVWLNIVLVLGKWFEAGVFGRILGFVGMAGNFGAILSTFPLAWWIATTNYRVPFIILGAVLIAAALLSGVLFNRTTPLPPHLKIPKQDQYPKFRKIFIHPWEIIAPMLAHWGFMGPFLGFASIFAIPMLHTLYGMNTVEGGYFLAIGLFGALIAGPIVGPLSDRWGRRIPYRIVGVADIAGWAVFALAGGSLPLYLLAFLFFLLGFVNGASVLTFAVVRDNYQGKDIGLASGIANTAGFISAVLVPLGIGWILSGFPHLSETSRDQWALGYIVIFAVMGTWGAFAIPHPRNHASSSTPMV